MKTAAEIQRIKYLNNIIRQINLISISLNNMLPIYHSDTEFDNLSGNILEKYDEFQKKLPIIFDKLVEFKLILADSKNVQILKQHIDEIFKHLNIAINNIGFSNRERYNDYQKVLNLYLNFVEVVFRSIEDTINELEKYLLESNIEITDELNEKLTELHDFAKSMRNIVIDYQKKQKPAAYAQDKSSFFNFSNYETQLFFTNNIEHRKFDGFIANHDTNNESEQIELDLIRYKGGDNLTALSREILDQVLQRLDFKSLATLIQVAKYYKAAKSDQYWQPIVLKFLSQVPRFKKNKDGIEENFYDYFKRHYDLFCQAQKLLRGFDKPIEVIELLHKLAGPGLDQLFLLIYNHYKVPLRLDVACTTYADKECLNFTLVHSAAGSNNIIILQLLIAIGAPLEKCADGFISAGDHGQWMENCGITPLQMAASKGAYDCVKMLLEHKVNVNYANTAWGQTALHDAAEDGHLSCVKLLVEAGATLDIKETVHNNTPYELAKESNHEECAAYLAEQMELKGIEVPKSNCLVM